MHQELKFVFGVLHLFNEIDGRVTYAMQDKLLEVIKEYVYENFISYSTSLKDEIRELLANSNCKVTRVRIYLGEEFSHDYSDDFFEDGRFDVGI